MNKQEFLKDVVILDVETTDSDTKTAEIVELATGSYENGRLSTDSELFRSVNPISFRASAVNNISNKIVKDKPTITDEWSSRVYNLLKFNDKSYAVAHNAKFDSAMLDTGYATALTHLGEEAIIPGYDDVKWICTYRLARHIFNDYDDIGFKLNELRYYFDLNVPDDLVMHRADADVVVAGALLEHIVDSAINGGIIVGDNIGDELYELCWSNIPITTISFGKYKDKLLSEIPFSYFEWLIDNSDLFDEKLQRYDNDLVEAVKNEMESRLE